MALRVLVVYRTIPTSNHNLVSIQTLVVELYIVLFLHQTTTSSTTFFSSVCCISYYSYIKPQLPCGHCLECRCCISYYSYIKPQLTKGALRLLDVVYRTIPTSNHNACACVRGCAGLYIVLFLHQTTTLL